MASNCSRLGYGCLACAGQACGGIKNPRSVGPWVFCYQSIEEELVKDTWVAMSRIWENIESLLAKALVFRHEQMADIQQSFQSTCYHRTHSGSSHRELLFQSVGQLLVQCTRHGLNLKNAQMHGWPYTSHSLGQS